VLDCPMFGPLVDKILDDSAFPVTQGNLDDCAITSSWFGNSCLDDCSLDELEDFETTNSMLCSTDQILEPVASRKTLECTDVESFTDSRGRERDCSWVGSRWGRCWKYGEEFCPETCDMQCTTKDPTASPTGAPPPTPPTVSPTPDPTGWCADVNSFIDRQGRERTCEWVKTKWGGCRKYGKDFCPETCDIACATPSPTRGPSEAWGSYGAPTVAPTAAPPPTVEPDCEDVESFLDSKGKERTCEWVASKNERWHDNGRTCAKYGPKFCPETCDVPCATPVPTMYFDPNGDCSEDPFFEVDGTWKSCWWVDRKDKCNDMGAYCPITCGLCESETTPSPPPPPEEGECADTEGDFVVKGHLRDCEWVGGGWNGKRCRKFGSRCPVTCQLCTEAGFILN